MYTLIYTFVAPLTLFSLFHSLKLWKFLQNCILLWFPTVFLRLFDLLTKMGSKLFEVMTCSEGL